MDAVLADVAVGVKKGDIVKVNGAVGILKDVYISPETGNYIIWFYGPKNAFKFQNGDIIPFTESELQERVKIVDKKELEEEIRLYKGMAVDNLRTNLGEFTNG